jgi:UrcA family protein
MRTPTFILSAPFLLSALCLAAHADASITGRSSVYVGDLNPNIERDARIMLQRIERAAKTACGGHAPVNPNTGSIDNQTFDECRAKAVRRAVTEFDAPVVARIFLESPS